MASWLVGRCLMHVFWILPLPVIGYSVFESYLFALGRLEAIELESVFWRELDLSRYLLCLIDDLHLVVARSWYAG